ncbi:MAG: hypothetical protein RLZZ283_603 [Candidatus Parcubacteria bacterium]
MEKPAVLLEWQGKEYEFVQKPDSWYYTVGIICVGGAIAAFIVGNILFGIVIILAGFTTALLASRKPAVHTFRITDRGIAVGDQLFRYDNIKSFAMDDNHEQGAQSSNPDKLLFELKRGVVTIMTIPLASVDHRKVRTELKNHNVEEVEHLNSLTARVSDWIGVG